MAKARTRLADRAKAARKGGDSAPVEARPATPGPVQVRENAIANVLGGAAREVTQRLVDPGTCRPWRRANRIYDHLTPENCADLIDTIAIDGQKIPAIVRRLPASEEHDYEIIAGARRHYAVSHLREERGRGDAQYLVEVHQLTDEEAFRLSDYENRSRRDISEYERGRDYATALMEFYDGNVSRMADGIGQPRSTLKLYLALAALPDRVLAAYPSRIEVPVRHAQTLAPLLRDEGRAGGVLAAADALAAEQAKGRGGEGRSVPPPEVLRRLTAEVSETAKPRRRGRTARAVTGANGRTLFAVRETRENLELSVPLPVGPARTQLIERLSALLETPPDT